MAKYFKFQYRFKIHNTERNLTEDFHSKLFCPRSLILISKSAKIWD